MKYLVGLSGGKDSTAVLLWIVHESGYEADDVIFMFSDTGNEASVTYEYIEFLSSYLQRHGYREIITLYPERDFFELAKHEKRFPSPKARFCAKYLKVKPLQSFIASLEDEVTNITGVRRLESQSRAELPERAFDKAGYRIYRPILDWGAKDVFAYLERFNVPRNPLYDLGFHRVGCFPCCMARKDEIRLIATYFPEVIGKIKECEKDGYTFFPCNKATAQFRRTAFTRGDKTWMCGSIDDVVEWSFTGKGGKYPGLFLGSSVPFFNSLVLTSMKT